MSNFIEELTWRGLLYAATEGAEEHLAGGRRTAYIGFDPTAKSLHVGSLLPIQIANGVSAVHVSFGGFVCRLGRTGGDQQ